MSDLKEFSQSAQEKVDKLLDELLPAPSVEPSRLHAAMRWSMFAGGKRFRPVVVFAVADLFGVPDEKIGRTAAAIEMVHTFSLIHDDLPAMDDDKLRRGKPTCHIKFDEATAILAGDALLTLAFHAIADDRSLETEKRLRLISELAEATGTPSGMVAGQQLDILSEGSVIEPLELERIHRHKTGALIRFAARASAIVADASDDELNAITDYASHLGLLFQITDDLLDVTQPSSVLGKTAGKDAADQKSTYVSLYGLEKAEEAAQNAYRSAISSLQEFGGDADLLSQIAEATLARNS